MQPRYEVRLKCRHAGVTYDSTVCYSLRVCSVQGRQRLYQLARTAAKRVSKAPQPAISPVPSNAIEMPQSLGI